MKMSYYDRDLADEGCDPDEDFNSDNEQTQAAEMEAKDKIRRSLRETGFMVNGHGGWDFDAVWNAAREHFTRPQESEADRLKAAEGRMEG